MRLFLPDFHPSTRAHLELVGSSWGYLILLYVYVQLSRVIVVGLLYPFLCHSGYGFDWKEAVILVWSGLRGAVALSLSLSVKQASGVNQPLLTSELGTLFVFFTGGIVFLTLIINGSTTQFLLHLLDMDKLSAAKIRILSYTRYEMLKKSLEAFRDLGDDEELGPADWPTVQRYITCLGNLDADEHTHDVTETEDHLKRLSLSDMRVRLLNGVQAAYWAMLDEGRISQATAMLLMRSVDEAMDVVSTEALSDWKGLKSNVHFPGYYRFLQSRFPQRLVTYFTVERLESACSLCAAFLRAHRIARRQLHEFIGDSEIASTVINESSEEGEDAKKFLEDVRSNLPQVLRVVKTRQVTYSILKHLSDYVQNLEKVGLLEEKEMVQLDDAVQSDFKRLLRNPPLVKMPKLSDLIGAHPLLGALPVDVREPLGSSTKEIIKERGTTLYKEGTKPNGIWLISMGVVKWQSRSLRNKYSLHPTFSHGNTLGLYEVLVGKPYLCDMITESVVHCFFFESDKILSLVRSYPAIEGFLWQESSLSISKILLPQIFEKMSMPTLRTLVAERSYMKIYIRGEAIEIRSNVIGLLLEGFVRNEDAQQEFVTSPAALLPSHSNLSIVSSVSTGFKNASFCHSGSCYHVETRARVIFFDLVAAELDSPLQKRPDSRLSQSVEPVWPSSREHEGLMIWPENFFTARNSDVTDVPQTNLSARAMQLSIYGSMMKDMRRPFRSFCRSSESRQNHSLSYPRVPTGTTTNVRPLVSVQSEGNSMNVRLGTRDFLRIAPIPPLPARRRRRNVGEDDSSDDSGGEAIVQIDSPRTLSFSQCS